MLIFQMNNMMDCLNLFNLTLQTSFYLFFKSLKFLVGRFRKTTNKKKWSDMYLKSPHESFLLFEWEFKTETA